MKIDILFLDTDLKGSEDFINDSSQFEEYCYTHSFEGKANQITVMPASYSKQENRTYLVGIGEIEANQELYELGINIGSKIKEDVEIDFLEEKNGIPEFFVVPGENELSAKFDWARVVSRRAERKCVRWHKHLEINDSEVIVYLNRLSDLLWMLAREFENDWTPSK